MSATAASSLKKPPRASAPRNPKPAPEHPTYAVMAAEAITQLKERSGSSKTAILKYITQHYNLGDNVTMINAHLKRALTRGVKKGEFKQMSGTGANGSFKVEPAYKTEKVAPAPRVKKPVVKKTTDEPKLPKKTALPKPKPEKKVKVPEKEVAPKPKTTKPPAEPKSKKSVKTAKKSIHPTEA